MRTTLLTLFLFIIMARPAESALPRLELLTPQNLHRLELVGLIQRGTVEEMAWSPDSARLAVVGSAGLRVFDVESGREDLLLGHWGGVNDVDFSPDGREIVSAGDDGTVRIWNAETRAQPRTFTPYSDLACACVYRVMSAKFSSDGARLWVGAENGPLRLIDAETGITIAQDERNVMEIVANSDRSRFAISEPRSPRLTVWPADGPFSPLHDLDMRFTVWNASFVPQTSRLLVAGFVGAELTLVDSTTSETIDMISGSRVLNVGTSGSMVTQVIDWIGEFRRISMRVTDIESGALQFNTTLPVEITDVRFSPSGDRIAVSDSHGAVTVWDWRRNLQLLRVPPRGTALIGLALLDNGLVASIDSEIGVVQTLTRPDIRTGETIRLWDLTSGRDVASFRTSAFGLEAADMLYWDARIGRLIIGSTTQPGLQLELDPTTGEVREVESYNVALLAEEQYVDEHPGGLLHAEALSNDDVRVSEVADERNAVTLRTSGPALRFAAGGELLLTTGPSGVIRLWGVRSQVPAAD